MDIGGRGAFGALWTNKIFDSGMEIDQFGQMTISSIKRVFEQIGKETVSTSGADLDRLDSVTMNKRRGNRSICTMKILS